jgi:hypothetical protein
MQDNRHLLATYTLNFIPPAKTTVDDIKLIASGVYKLCDAAIRRITAGDEGCAESLRYYRPSKAKHYTDNAAADGTIRAFFGNYFDTVATLQVDFTEDT